MIDPRLDQSTALITGANHGIGAATARALAAQGARVFLGYYRVPPTRSQDELDRARALGTAGIALYQAQQQNSAETIADEIRRSGGGAIAHEADLEDTNNIPVLFDICEDVLGPVDLLILNHACCSEETFDPLLSEGTDNDAALVSATGIDRHHAVNVRASALLLSEYVRRYLARNASSGRIIVVSTDAAHRCCARPCRQRKLCCQQACYGILRSLSRCGVGPAWHHCQCCRSRANTDRLHNRREQGTSGATNSSGPARNARGHRGRDRVSRLGAGAMADRTAGLRWRRLSNATIGVLKRQG